MPGPSIAFELEVARRLRDLPATCRQLELGLLNDEDDPALVFADLSYCEVMTVALRHPVVARALTRLPSDWRWPRD